MYNLSNVSSQLSCHRSRAPRHTTRAPQMFRAARRVIVLSVHTAQRKRFRGASAVDSNFGGAVWRAIGACAIASAAAAGTAVPTLSEPAFEHHVIDSERVQQLRSRMKDLFEESEEARWLDDGDFTLERFLVSRNYNLDEAELMFRNAVAWRSRHKVRRELEEWRGEDSQQRRLSTLYGYAARAGVTEDGVPLNIERIGQYDIAGCVAVPGMTDLVAKAYIMYLEETFHDLRACSINQGRVNPFCFVTSGGHHALDT
jgi:hypothetical protein